jgi:orotate phosphoribosyltransferase
MNRNELSRRIFQVSNLKGEFLLRSGQISDEYFDKYLFEADPALLKTIAEAMSALIPVGTNVIAGLEMGGIPIATMLSQITGFPSLFVRKQAKPYGTCKLAEGGPVSGRKLIIIEDVVTSGGQILESVRALRNMGGIIADVLCVIDRESGGRDNLRAEDLSLHPLFTMSELKEAANLMDLTSNKGG